MNDQTLNDDVLLFDNFTISRETYDQSFVAYPRILVGNGVLNPNNGKMRSFSSYITYLAASALVFDEAREICEKENAELRTTLTRLLAAFGTEATLETKLSLTLALSEYENMSGMEDEANVLRTTIEAISAVLKTDDGEDDDE